MRLLILLLALVLACPLWAKNVSAPQLLQLVDYVGVDYEEAVDNHGQVINPNEYKEMQEFSATILEAVKALPESTSKADLVLAAEKLVGFVENNASVQAVRAQTKSLSRELQIVLNVPMTPTHVPDAQNGKQFFETTCVACHGATGAGDGPLAAGLDPAPTNFLDANRMAQLSTFALYNTITLGVDGTSMASYEHTLSNEQRWDLAYYIEGLLGPVDPISIALYHLDKSMKKLAEGDREGAYQAALAAYLDGFETAEAVLDILDRNQRLLLEEKMMGFRMAIEKGADQETLDGLYAELTMLLKDVQAKLPTTEFSNVAVFLSALIILLREGLESILIVGMLIVMIIKSEKRELLPAIHIGWILALCAGVFTWWGSHTLINISGATREVTEGIIALVAAGMLLYVGIWIHRHQLAHNWRAYIKEKLSGHLANEARLGLGVLSFLAVYREIFETILFYEALSLQVGAQSTQMIWMGIGAAAALLLFTVCLMMRYSLRLPLEQFFRVTGILIFIFAIVFIGQGIHGLEEAGKVPAWPVPVPRIDVLGIYPNLFGLMFQAAVLAIAVYIGWKDRR